MSDNAIVRSILNKTLGKRINSLTSSQYSVLHNSLEMSLKSAVPRGTDLTKFDSRSLSKLSRKHPRRRMLKDFTEDAFVKKIAMSAGLQGFNKSEKEPLETCLVLSGSGAKGAFEVGFLAYLKKIWDQLNVTAVCGTSIGAFNSVPIAQSGKEGIDLLVSIWLELKTNDDMYMQYPAIGVANSQLKSIGLDGIEDINDLFGGGGLRQLRQLLEPNNNDGISTGSVGTAIAGAAVGGPFGLFLALAGIASGSISTAESTGDINQLKFKVRMLGSALQNIFSAPGLNMYPPLEKIIKDNFNIGDIGKSGMPKLRLAMLCLEDGEPYYFTEKGTLIKGNTDQSQRAEVFWSEGLTVKKITKAIIASSSAPVLFPPVVLKEDNSSTKIRDNKHFVDGGVRELLPVQAGLDLGCERVIGVLSQPLRMNEQTYDKSPPSVFDYVFRIMETMSNEIALNDAKMLPEGSTIFSYPLVDIIEPFEIDPGLIRISLDYGYMRGYDATLDIVGKDIGGWGVMLLWMAESMIIQLRREIWELEETVVLPMPRGFGQSIIVFREKILSSIRKKKQELMEWTLIRFKASKDDKDSLPIFIEGRNGPATDIHDWWGKWEQHKPGFKQTAFEQYDLWSRLRIGVTGPFGNIDVYENSVPDKPKTNKF